MDTRYSVQNAHSRAPMGNNPQRANSVPTGERPQSLKAHETAYKENNNAGPDETYYARRSTKQQTAPVNPRIAAVTQAYREGTSSNRTSQISNASASTTNSDGQIKSYIGPWQLGKTLGKGSSAHVRLARHRVSLKSVAVKIIAKRTAYLSQAGSIARLDKLERKKPQDDDGVRRLPVTIEREIAIMKLIEHPNIIQIFDVWECHDEIYIVLEYCDSKDMFAWINRHGPMSEHDAVFVFRQMMCAIEYCHSFNICHRDLKPENILLSPRGQVKIIDFGMAALHQNGQSLRTACGSPHYAAPELLKSRTYRGDKADVWSMGVILFAMMAQKLPFDDPHLPTILSLSKRGIYSMPEEFSPEMKDMIARILVTDPDQRISIREMWEHPLLRKYADMPAFQDLPPQPLDMKASFHDISLHASDIDPVILRQLRAIWHSSDVQDIKVKLTEDGPSEQKLFYNLLVARRDRLLENYDPELAHSASDYHHLRPHAWATRVSTRQFSNHGRLPSRFTVISTIADTDAGGTVRSYDPYHASRNLDPVKASRARIVIHRGKLEPGTARSLASGSVPSRMGTMASSRVSRKAGSSLRSHTMSYAQSYRSSVSSIRSYRQETTGLIVKPRRKRGVDFSSRRRKNVQASRRRSIGQKIIASASIAGDQTTYDRDNTSPQSPRKKTQQENENPTDSVDRVRLATPMLDEEIIRFSYSIAKDCDDAFGSSLLGPSESDGRDIRSSLTPFSIEFGNPSIQQTPEPVYKPQGGHIWDSRPLPPTPPMELTPSPAKTPKIKIEPQSPSPSHDAQAYYGPNVTNLTVAPLNLSNTKERRTSSAPVYAQYARDPRPLPSIWENSPAPAKAHGRIVSAPAPLTPAYLQSPNDKRSLDYLANAEQTIRLVQSPSARKSMVVQSLVPAPLNVRKKAAVDSTSAFEGQNVPQESLNGGKKYSFHSQLQGLPEEPAKHGGSSSHGSSIGAKKKLSTWFRRASRVSSKGEDTEVADMSLMGDEKPQEVIAAGPPQRFGSTCSDAVPPATAAPQTKKKSLMFWKNNKNDQRMSIVGPNYDEHSINPDSQRNMSSRQGRVSHDFGQHNDPAARKIEPQQNWLARLFRVKPSTRLMCLQMSSRRARQEVVLLLREWRKWGIRDVEVDKERNIVFARVGKKNFLDIKEVHFAVEIMTVIEHGKRNHLSIVRFTQERGAASSFHKVVDTMNNVFSNRTLLVQDSRKAKMMVKTLNS